MSNLEHEVMASVNSAAMAERTWRIRDLDETFIYTSVFEKKFYWGLGDEVVIAARG